MDRSCDYVFNSSFHLCVEVRCLHRLIFLIENALKKRNIYIFPPLTSIIPTKRTNYETKLLLVGLINVVIQWLCSSNVLTLLTPTISFEPSLEISVSCDLVS